LLTLTASRKSAAVLVGGRVAGFEDPRVDAPAEMLDEGAERTPGHRRDPEGGVEGEAGGRRGQVSHVDPGEKEEQGQPVSRLIWKL
jgi:hypothetical protein